MTGETNTVTDPRPMLYRAVALAGDVIQLVSPDQLDGPTPCPDFDVRALVGHLIGVLQRVAVVGRGEDPMKAPFVADAPPEQWPAAWARGARDVEAVWSDDPVLDRELRVPWTTMPGRDVAGIYTSELTLHTWDLAQATGQKPAWDGEVVAASLAAMQTQLPADGREQFPFAAVVEVPADAPAIDRLVAWSGRRP